MIPKLLLSLCILFTCTLVASKSNNRFNYKPVIMFHGLGDTAFGSINSVIKQVKKELNDSIYVNSILMGRSAPQDFLGSYFNNMNDKLEEICENLKKDEELKDGFTLIGFSQGGQFSRALVQRCDVKVLNLITLGAQHQGIYGLPRCTSEKHFICRITDKLFNLGFYTERIQKSFVPAQYWHDMMNYTNYITNSQFIAEINNEVEVKEIYKQRLTALKKFIMVKFESDTIVDPIESEHFGFFEYGDLKKIVKLEDSRLYKEDRLGLRKLDETKRLIRINLPGDHLQMPREWFKNEIINQYIKSEIN